MGMGELRLSPSSFYSMTMPELFAAIRGSREATNRVNREAWERVRWHAAVVASTVPRKNKRGIRPQDLMKFPWDKIADNAPSTDEIRASLERIKKRDRNREAWKKTGQ